MRFTVCTYELTSFGNRNHNLQELLRTCCTDVLLYVKVSLAYTKYRERHTVSYSSFCSGKLLRFLVEYGTAIVLPLNFFVSNKQLRRNKIDVVKALSRRSEGVAAINATFSRYYVAK